MEDLLQIGKVVNCHGIRGEVKIIPLTSDLDLFISLDYLILQFENLNKKVAIDSARPNKGSWIVKLNGFNSISEAERLKGINVFYEKAKLKPLEEDEFYLHDLLNSDVYNLKQEYLGRVSHYFENGEQIVCKVEKDDYSFLFPTSKEILKEIRVDENIIIIDPVPELLELNKKKEKN